MSTISTPSVFGRTEEEKAERLRQVKAEVYKLAQATEAKHAELSAAGWTADNVLERQSVDEDVGKIIDKTFHLMRESRELIRATTGYADPAQTEKVLAAAVTELTSTRRTWRWRRSFSRSWSPSRRPG